MKRHWKSIAGSLISIVFGFMLGLSFHSWRFRPPPHGFRGPEHRAERFFNRLARQLSLSNEQRKQARMIFDAQRDEMRRVRAEVFPKFQRLQEAARKEIRKILTPEQQVKFDEMHKHMRERRRERFGPPMRHRRGPGGMHPRRDGDRMPPPGPPPMFDDGAM